MLRACGLRPFSAGGSSDTRGEGSDSLRCLAMPCSPNRGVHLWTNGGWIAAYADLALASQLPRAAAKTTEVFNGEEFEFCGGSANNDL